MFSVLAGLFMMQNKGTMWSVCLLLGLSSLSPLALAISCPSACVCTNIGGNEQKVEVDCQHKNFTTIPTNLNKQTEVLKLNGNKITALPSAAFSSTSLNNLQKLRIRFNEIATIHKDAFKNLKKLQVLNLEFNQISSLDSETFKHNKELEILSLSNNPISRIEDGLFSNLPELSFVELENCKLSYIGPKAFENVPNLLYLYLSNNKLAHVDFTTLFPLSNLRMIMKKNPWKCDCKLKPLRDHMEKGFVGANAQWYKDNSPVCAEPPQLANKTWVQTKSQDFKC